MVNLHRVISVQVLLFVKYMLAQKNTEFYSFINSNSSKNYCNVTDISYLSNRLDQHLSTNIFNLDHSHFGINPEFSRSKLLNNRKFSNPNLFEDCSTLKDQNLYPSVIKSSGISLNNNLDRIRVNSDNVCNDGQKKGIISETNESKLNEKVGTNRNYNKLCNSTQYLNKNNLINSEFRNNTQNTFNVCDYYITSEFTTDNVLSNNNVVYNNAKDSLMVSIRNNDLKRIDSKHDKIHYIRNNNSTNLRLRDNDKVRHNLFYDVSCSNIKKCNGNENNLIDSRQKVKRDCKLYIKRNSINKASNSFEDLCLNNNLQTDKDVRCLLPDKCEYDNEKNNLTDIGTQGFMVGTDIKSNIEAITQNRSAYLLDMDDLISEGSNKYPANNISDSSSGKNFNNCQNYTSEDRIDEINFKGNNNIGCIQNKGSFDEVASGKSCNKIFSKQKANNEIELVDENDLQPEGTVQRKNNSSYESLFNKQSTLYKMAEKISQGYIEDMIKNSTYPWKADEFRERILDNVLLRIIGGHTVSIDSFPYMVTLHLRGQTICGGTIITEHHVLTAGHCVVREVVEDEVYIRDPSSLHIRAGTTYSDYGGIIRRVAGVYPHPRYGAGFLYDLGIVLLQEPLEISRKVHMVGLAGPEETNELYRMMREEHTCWVAGWGDVHPNLISKPSPRRTRRNINPSNLRVHYSNHLKAVKTKMMTWEKCKEVQPWVHEDCMICTGHNDISGPCQRDSGSPLICSGLQFGIVSWGEGCGRPEEPDIFSRVDTAYDFIMDTVNPPPYQQMTYPEAVNDSGKTASFLNALMFLFIIFM